MRHFLLTIMVTVLTCSVFKAARPTQLIALTRFLQGLGSRQLCAITGAVTLSTVAVTADQYRYVTAGA